MKLLESIMSKLIESEDYNKYRIDIQDYANARFYDFEKCRFIDDEFVVEYDWKEGKLSEDDKDYKKGEYEIMLNQIIDDVEEDNGVDFGIEVKFSEVFDTSDTELTNFVYEIKEK